MLNGLLKNSKLNIPNILKMNKYKRRINTIFKEAENTNNIYCVNIKLSSQFNIIFEIYSEANPKNLYFKSKLNINDLKSLHTFFYSFKDINEIFEAINDIINKGKYDISFDSSQNKKIILILFVGNEQIKIDINKENISIEGNDLDMNEFIYDFYRDYLNLKLIFNYQFNQKNEEIRQIKEENKEIKNKLKEIQKEDDKLKTKIKNLKKKISDINNNIERKASKNYPKKEVFNKAKVNSLNDNDGYLPKQNINNTQIFNFNSPQTYSNNNTFNYYNDYLTYINNQITIHLIIIMII